jgi:origin recognition complex subunit 6
MSHSLQQALLSLLPALSGPLPPALVELASSLVAQSRQRASTLKAEEEIARPYACAHMACDRWVEAARVKVFAYMWLCIYTDV